MISTIREDEFENLALCCLEEGASIEELKQLIDDAAELIETVKQERGR